MYKVLIVLFLFLIPKEKVQKKSDFSGVWESRSNDHTFSIDLRQNNNRIRGEYCSTLDNEATINCDIEDKYTGLTGEVNNGLLKLSYRCYYDPKIKAKILIRRLNKNTIEWRVQNPRKNSEFFVPLIDTLYHKQ